MKHTLYNSNNQSGISLRQVALTLHQNQQVALPPAQSPCSVTTASSQETCQEKRRRLKLILSAALDLINSCDQDEDGWSEIHKSSYRYPRARPRIQEAQLHHSILPYFKFANSSERLLDRSPSNSYMRPINLVCIPLYC
jgi:hypothetical protein